MTDREDIDLLAAEYVLGTLDPPERTAVAARRQREPALEAAIGAWEQRLAPLTETARDVAPPADMLARIERRLASATSAPALSAVAGGTVVDLQRRVTRWKRATYAATALAACLAVAIGLRETLLAPTPPRYVAVFQKDDASPAFMMTVDLATKQLTVRMVAAEVPPDKTYQLWIATPSLGPNPRSLGLIDRADYTLQRAALVQDAAVLRNATFGVSLEPAGGSPTGLPTGPVFHAKLIQLTP
jgi:anti-sigma-K factor RskA